MNAPDITWVILAGGKASRMGGVDKGLVTLNGQPFIEHVFNKLTAQTPSVLINANRNQQTYRQLAPVFSDAHRGYLGPLAGVYSAFQHSDSDWIGIVPCDCPDLSSELVARFTDAVEPQHHAYVAYDGQFPQPTFALFHRSTLPALTAFLEQGERKLMLFLRQQNARFVDFSDQAESFRNLNTPEELTNFSLQTA